MNLSEIPFFYNLGVRIVDFVTIIIIAHYELRLMELLFHSELLPHSLHLFNKSLRKL